MDRALALFTALNTGKQVKIQGMTYCLDDTHRLCAVGYEYKQWNEVDLSPVSTYLMPVICSDTLQYLYKLAKSMYDTECMQLIALNRLKSSNSLSEPSIC